MYKSETNVEVSGGDAVIPQLAWVVEQKLIHEVDWQPLTIFGIGETHEVRNKLQELVESHANWPANSIKFRAVTYERREPLE